MNFLTICPKYSQQCFGSEIDYLLALLFSSLFSAWVGVLGGCLGVFGGVLGGIYVIQTLILNGKGLNFELSRGLYNNQDG